MSNNNVKCQIPNVEGSWSCGQCYYFYSHYPSSKSSEAYNFSSVKMVYENNKIKQKDLFKTMVHNL